MLWSFEAQFRAYDRVRDHAYYWTNCYYWLQDDALSTPTPTIVGDLDAASWYALRQNTVRQNYRVRCSTWAYDVVTQSAHPGSIGPSVLSWFIPWYFLVRGYDDSGNQVAYKRLRGCWALEDVDSGQMTDELYTYLRGYTEGYLEPLPLCSVRGIPVVRWEVDRVLRLWQQRHGSSRVTRPVFV